MIKVATGESGLCVGYFTDSHHPTGCTVILTKDGAVDVRGAAPGTCETPPNLVEKVHAGLLFSGSAFVMTAILFDLGAEDGRIRSMPKPATAPAKPPGRVDRRRATSASAPQFASSLTPGAHKWGVGMGVTASR